MRRKYKDIAAERDLAYRANGVLAEVLFKDRVVFKRVIERIKGYIPEEEYNDILITLKNDLELQREIERIFKDTRIRYEKEGN